MLGQVGVGSKDMISAIHTPLSYRSEGLLGRQAPHAPASAPGGTAGFPEGVRVRTGPREAPGHCNPHGLEIGIPSSLGCCVVLCVGGSKSASFPVALERKFGNQCSKGFFLVGSFLALAWAGFGGFLFIFVSSGGFVWGHTGQCSGLTPAHSGISSGRAGGNLRYWRMNPGWPGARQEPDPLDSSFIYWLVMSWQSRQSWKHVTLP